MKKMTQPTITLLLLIPYFLSIGATTSPSKSSSTSFINASCKATIYTVQCVRSLSPYASTIGRSQRKLAQTALNVSLARAQSCKAFVAQETKLKGLKSKEYKALDVCLNQIGDSVDRLSQSVKELNHVGKNKSKDVAWGISNVQTWVSAALTDQNTCLDAFSYKALNGKVKNSTDGSVTGVIQVTSNALALINKYSDTL